MPNVKLSDANHKRLTILTGELKAEKGRQVYMNDAVEFLLDFYEGHKPKEVIKGDDLR